MRSYPTVRTLLIVGCLAGMPVFVLAQDEHKHADTKSVHAADAHGHGDAHAGEDHHAHHIHGKPPEGPLGKGTEFLAVSPQLFIWTLGLFLLVWFLLSQIVWKPVIAAFEQRDHRIAESLRLAQEVRADAKRLLEQHDVEFGKAHEEAKRILDEARAMATAEANAMLAKAREESTASQEQALAEIESARTEAIARLRSSAAGLSADMAGRLVNKSFVRSEFEGWADEEATP